MKKNNFSKNDLLFYYQKYEFPKELISNNCLIHKEFLFSEETVEPENYTNSKKKIKLSNSFILESELENKKVPFKKNTNTNPRHDYNVSRGNNQNNPNANSWRKNELEDPGFFDNFKGKSDERQVISFKRNIVLITTNDNNFSISNNVFYDHHGNFLLNKFNLK